MKSSLFSRQRLRAVSIPVYLPHFRRSVRCNSPLLMAGAMLTAIALILSMSSALARELPEPEGEVVLRLAGKLQNTNHGDEAHFDLAMLKDLPLTSFETKTPWDEGTQQFAGFRLSDLFELVGAAPQSFEAVGLDDYKFTVNDLDYQRIPVIVAYEHNGEPISVRRLGPLRIMYPFTDYPELGTVINESGAVWQLVAINLH